jgi:hypothetical protein
MHSHAIVHQTLALLAERLGRAGLSHVNALQVQYFMQCSRNLALLCKNFRSEEGYLPLA